MPVTRVPDESVVALPVTAAQAAVLTSGRVAAAAATRILVVEIDGAADPDRLADAVRRTVLRAEALHVRLRSGADGTWRQVPVSRESMATWRPAVVDVRGTDDPEASAQRWMDVDRAVAVDVTGREPLFTHAVLRVADDRTLWYQRYHEAIVDDAGVALIVEDVAARYGDPNLASPSKDWSLAALVDADREYRASSRFAADRGFWLTEIAAAPESPRICRTAVDPVAPPETTTVEIESAIAAALAEFAAAVGIRRARVPMALLVAYLHHCTGRRDVTVSVPVSARVGGAMHRTPGTVATVLPVTFRVDPDTTVGDLAHAIDARLTEVLRHGRFPVGALVQEMAAPGRRVFGPSIGSMTMHRPLVFGEHRARIRDVFTGPVDDLAFTVLGGADGEPIRIDLRAPAGRRRDLLRHQDRLVAFVSRFLGDPVSTIGSLELPSGEPELVGTDDDTAALAPAQRLHWLRHRAAGASARADHAIVLRLRDPIDVDALARALDDVVDRHAPLRTVFIPDGGDAIASPGARPAVDVIEVGGEDLDRRAYELAQLRIDVTMEAPLRVHVVRDDARRQALLLTMHHLAVDEGSVAPLIGDLLTAYAARVDGVAPRWEPLDVQYADYARWQSARLGDSGEPSGRYASQLAFWRKRLAGMPTRLHLPASAGVREPRRRMVPIEIDAEVHEGALRFAHRTGTDLPTILQAALVTLLSRHGAGSDIPIGVFADGRGPGEVADVLTPMVGCFANVVIVRTDIAGHPDFEEILDRVRVSTLEAFEHGDIGFADVAAELPGRGSERRFPQVVLVRHDALPVDEFAVPVESIASVPVGLPSAELTFGYFDPAGPGPIRGYFEFSTGTLDRESVVGWARGLPALLTSVVRRSGVPSDARL
ncbi:condensation domain-containing protein [Prescottella sp. R16]|uniref:condensation domain-containing protein n=1 Tax=Prescottella sp. R16 TaxID=3064529 RepID=UPI00272E9E94|nr:condensation domain-containing protein [Prescottella sp. R16]